MPRTLLHRHLPDKYRLHHHWLLRRLGARLHHPRLWHLNRRTVSGATGVGLFVAFLPLPFQIVLVTLVALWLRVNLPLAVAWIFVTNPLTMGPAYYLCYKLGAWLLQSPPLAIRESFQPNVSWLLAKLHIIWQPLAVGSLVVSITAGLLGYILVQFAWRAWIMHKRKPALRNSISR